MNRNRYVGSIATTNCLSIFPHSLFVVFLAVVVFFLYLISFCFWCPARPSEQHFSPCFLMVGSTMPPQYRLLFMSSENEFGWSTSFNSIVVLYAQAVCPNLALTQALVTYMKHFLHIDISHVSIPLYTTTQAALVWTRNLDGNTPICGPVPVSDIIMYTMTITKNNNK